MLPGLSYECRLFILFCFLLQPSLKNKIPCRPDFYTFRAVSSRFTSFCLLSHRFVSFRFISLSKFTSPSSCTIRENFPDAMTHARSRQYLTTLSHGIAFPHTHTLQRLEKGASQGRARDLVGSGEDFPGRPASAKGAVEGLELKY